MNRPETNLELQKMLWANIAELRLADAARSRRRRIARAALLWGGAVLAALAVAATAVLWLR